MSIKAAYSPAVWAQFAPRAPTHSRANIAKDNFLTFFQSLFPYHINCPHTLQPYCHCQTVPLNVTSECRSPIIELIQSNHSLAQLIRENLAANDSEKHYSGNDSIAYDSEGNRMTMNQAQAYIAHYKLHPPLSSQSPMALPYIEPPVTQPVLAMHNLAVASSVHGTCCICNVSNIVTDSSTDSDVDSQSLMLQCEQCLQTVHAKCFTPPLELPSIFDLATYRCPSCIRCCVCKEPRYDASLLVCQKCTRGYHCQCTGQTIAKSKKKLKLLNDSKTDGSVHTINDSVTKHYTFICDECIFVPRVPVSEERKKEKLLKKKKTKDKEEREKEKIKTRKSSSSHSQSHSHDRSKQRSSKDSSDQDRASDSDSDEPKSHRKKKRKRRDSE